MRRFPRDVMIKKRLFFTFLLLMSYAFSAHAISFALDSIAEWGKFPRFCVNTYRWGDRFFNGYDTVYVQGTGYKFNVKTRVDSYMDFYNFRLPNDVSMSMISRPSTSAGIWLTYLAVSVGYDKNFSKLFSDNNNAREKFYFGFNCSLFACNLYYINNHGGTVITYFGPDGKGINPDMNFNGAVSKSLGCNMVFFFNHKKYSQAAAFNYSRIQKKSQGSFFAGIDYSNRSYYFDFNELPDYMKSVFPVAWDNLYTAKNRNYSIKTGYGYNWVFADNWLLAFSESPSVGLRRGYINSTRVKNSFALSNQFKASLVWNHKQLFAGIIGEMNSELLYDKDSTFGNGTISCNVSFGYRFNLW